VFLFVRKLNSSQRELDDTLQQLDKQKREIYLAQQEEERHIDKVFIQCFIIFDYFDF